MPEPNAPGVYGKLPVLGDFISRRLPARFVQTWDAWLQEALSTSRQQLATEWLEIYLYSPIWRFILSAGNCGPTAWAGVLMPSVDRVNRYFPLTLAVSIAAQNALPSLFVAAASWFDKLEQLALSALEDEVNLDDFDRHLQEQILDIPVPTPGRHAFRDDPAATRNDMVFQVAMENPDQVANACLQLSADLLATFLPVHSLWTTSGSERMSPALLAYAGLPPVAAYAELLTGQWQQDIRRNQSLASFAFPTLEGQEAVASREQKGDNNVGQMRWHSWACSTVGKLRKINEDGYLERPEIGLWAVADGMGGHQAGDVASQTIVNALAGVPASDTLETLMTHVIACLQQVNAELLNMANEFGPGQIIGSTVVVMLAVAHQYASIWVGDSRLYCYRNGVLSQLTHDHSLTAELSQEGISTEVECADSVHGHIITRALGAQPELSLDTITHEAQDDDVYLLCSDGLVNELTSQEITTILSQGECHESAQRLIDLALARGARDNVTVIVVRAAYSQLH
jgi:type VI secretion system protein ImpM